MRIMWMSNAPWAPTGYGNQTQLFTPLIKNLGHDVAVTAFYGLEGRIIDVNGIRLYPRHRHPYGVDVINAHASNYDADIVITLIDAWVIDPRAFSGKAKWVAWFPVDSEPLPPKVANAVTNAYRRIVFSKFGERMVHEAGMDCYYVPHGVDTKLFRPRDRAQARRLAGLPDDRFLVGMVAANKGNPSRKAFVENIAAFKILHDKHPDALLYLHTDKGTQGGANQVNLPEYVSSLGLVEGRDVIFADSYLQLIGFGDEFMSEMYNALDVHLLASMGEGFGIPILEAQACGCPVIIGDWTAMSELCFSGWKVSKSDAQPFWTTLAAYQYIPRVDAIADCLAQAYRMAGNEDYRKRARDGALAYDAEKIAHKYWKPVLEEIEQDVRAWNPVPTCRHEWLKVGLYNNDGSISVPCKKCGAEMKDDRHGQRQIVPDGFKNKHDLKFTDPDGLEWLIMRETDRDYATDGLNLNKDSVVVDIGAHVGVVSMTLAKQFGCHVYAYEPEASNFDRLVENVKINELADLVEYHNLAVTGDGRIVTIATNPDNSGGGDIYHGNGTQVASLTLADILAHVGGHIDLLKIDCEGAEFEILQNDADLEKIGMIRGEFHGREAPALLVKVRETIPDTHVTLQGVNG